MRMLGEGDKKSALHPGFNDAHIAVHHHVLRACLANHFRRAGHVIGMRLAIEQNPQDGPHVFIDPEGYKEFVADAQETFEKALSKQEAGAVH